jgi:GT2 family glycosyltransferase
MLNRRWKDLILGGLHVLRTQGTKEFAYRSVLALRRRLQPPTYERWISRYDTLTNHTRAKLRADISRWDKRPLISVLMPVTNFRPNELGAAIRSLTRQLYSNWELCVTSDASIGDDIKCEILEQARQESRLRLAISKDFESISDKFNRALGLASGEYFALMTANVELSEQAFYWVVKEIIDHPDVDLIFSDEDKINGAGKRCEPWFKQDWNSALMLSQNAFGNLGIYRRRLAEKVGGFRPGYEGHHDYDLALRCASETSQEHIRHIPRILYHCRGKNVTTAPDREWRAGRRVVEEHLVRANIDATVERACDHSYRVEYTLPSPLPRVSVLIATTGNERLLEPCMRSILKLTSYHDFEVILLVNEQYKGTLKKAEFSIWLATQPRVRILPYLERPFNYSSINNWGERQASGDILCFLNDDTVVITSDWLERLTARVSLSGVAAAGPMLFYPNETIQHAGVILGLGDVGVAGHACDGMPRGSCGYYDRGGLEQDVSALTAACLMMRRSVFQEVGGFNEDLPVTFNDVDLCLRLGAAGWRLIWTPTVELYHHESSSIGVPYSRERREEISAAAALMRKRWGAILDNDPYYNSNLSLRRAFDLSFPPRQRLTAFPRPQMKS